MYESTGDQRMLLAYLVLEEGGEAPAVRIVADADMASAEIPLKLLELVLRAIDDGG